MEPERLHIDVHMLNQHDNSEQTLREILQALRLLARQGVRIMSALTNLADAVAANTTVAGSAVQLLKGLKAKLDEAIASGDPAAVQALSDTLAADTAVLAEAVTANTPADPAPAPAP